MSRASGYHGVYYHKASRKWAAQIRIPAHQRGAVWQKSKVRWIGLFNSDKLAAKAYDEEARKWKKRKLNLVNPDDWKYFIKPEA